MACVCSGYNTYSDWQILWHYYPVMTTGKLQACKKPHNKQLINLEHSVFVGKSQTLTLLY